jgi:signal peptidase I
MTERGRRRRRLVANLAFAILFIAACAAWFVALRPAPLGGPATYVIVRGVSMEPTYHAGDLVIVRRRPDYRVGDIVAYTIPADEVGGGLSVIHRIVGGSRDTGFETKGDNNAASDPWRPTLGQIEGTAWLVLPKTGAILSSLRAPITLASFAAAAAVAMVIYWQGGREERERQRRDEQETAERDSDRRTRAISSTTSRSG